VFKIGIGIIRNKKRVGKLESEFIDRYIDKHLYM
jgi:hypothetical protein